ncbi:MAG: Helicase associated domain protein [Planctomycetota bacterium]|nr:Helicase associated domain protein [Planctomycetota bacterium]
MPGRTRDESQPRHPKTREFVSRGLFEGVSCFEEFERRVADLPTPNERGDAFEVFAEAYLATSPIVQAKHVWPFSSIPIAVRQQLRLDTGIDMGVDGVLENGLGQFAAYQVKFRTDRPALTWDELSTFMGLTDQVGQRVLFTNCDDLPALMNERTNFFCIRGSDLNGLGIDDFRFIGSWLQGEPAHEVRKIPLPHQQEALADIQRALAANDRATGVMACGTGKTLVALWTAESLRPRNVLILLPSLALLRQTLHEWLRQTSWRDLSYLCVCSDPSVDTRGDAILVRQSDLDFPVTTDPAIVRQFLSLRSPGTKLVFSTYQSAQVVAAGMSENDVFDLAVFDEAHKTAGRVGVRFAFALTDEHLPIRKRLFLTATPRHFDIARKDNEGEARLVYSMDVPEIYGPVAHNLTFAVAARRDIVCPYKVLISVVTSETVNEERLRRGEVVVDGDLLRARHVAKQIALQKAVEEYGASKIITFHRSIKAAEKFTSSGGEGIETHLPGFQCFHVNGNMPTARREQFMRAFAESPKAVISNARCLTEGVDVPAVDMVAFLSPKHSWIDIVQATGRAMRKSPSKQIGYVLVPLFVEEHRGESIQEALKRTGFHFVWDVLEAMLEQDEGFAEVIRKMREERGRVGGVDESALGDFVEFIGDHISLAEIQRFIAVAAVDRLGADWDERFGQLLAFKERYGHFNIIRRHRDFRTLGHWVKYQRQLHRKGAIRPDRVRRLESIGFEWEGGDRKETWEKQYRQLEAFREKHEHCNVPKRHPDFPGLWIWVHSQRALYRKGQLESDRLRQLESLGFQWVVYDSETVWNLRLKELEAFVKKHGHCDVPVGCKENPQLGIWVANVRAAAKAGRLPEERQKYLERLGFNWRVRRRTKRRLDWDEMYRSLAELKVTHGHLRIPTQEFPQLFAWTHSLRRLRKAGKLSDEQIAKLDSLGFEWTRPGKTWDEMFAALVEYKNRHGDCMVPREWPDNPCLSRWAEWQRAALRKGKVQPKRREQLEGIGFEWMVPDAEDRWEQMFGALVDFKQRHGHCLVPRRYDEVPELGRWVNSQRFQRLKGRLGPDRISRLEAIGFEWAATDAAWEAMFDELKRFRVEFGHCRVPANWEKNPELGKWVARHRQIWRGIQEGEHTPRAATERRLARLEEFGIQFVSWTASWDEDLRALHWDENLRALQEYRQRFGHCAVPANWSENPNLARWVAAQRAARRTDNLSAGEVSQLTKLGFIWNLHERKWEEMFLELLKYKEQHGDCDVPAQRSENPRLSSWVGSQRSARKAGRLSQDRIELLDEAGFIWVKKRGRPSN